MKRQARPIVGIDLGTTNSAVAFIEKGAPRIIPSPRGERIIPSAVMIDLEENVLIGEAARASQVVMPERVITAAKRKMGSTEPLTMAGRQFLPQEVAAMILKELKDYADTIFGAGEKEAVITVPAYFTDEQRRATKQAGELAGFVVERIINEPTAAALAFGLQNLAETGNILVYDLGGGTFDVSVVEMMNGILEVKASAGNNMLGGEDFDWLVAGWLAEKIKKKYNFDPLEDIRAKNLLKEQAEKIKIELSAAEKTTVHLPVVAIRKDKPVGLTTEFTRADFVGLIEGHLAETMDCVRKVLRDAALNPADIREILLVGGSTRIPRVRELIVEFFHKEPRRDIQPEEAVALGAAVQAGLKSGLLKKSGLIVTDVAPFSLGISVLGNHHGSVRPGVFSVIIPRNTTVPVCRSEYFTTSAPGQTEARIEIYQGEHELTKYNHRLGEFMLCGIPASWKKSQEIEVTYSYNLNGILEVTATALANKKQERLTVHDTLERDTEEAFAQSAEKLRRLYENIPPEDDEYGADEEEDFFGGIDFEDIADIEDMDIAELETKAENLRQELKTLQKILSRQHKALNDTQRQKIKKIAAKLEQALDLPDNDTAKIEKLIEETTDLLIDLEFTESDS